MTRTTIATSRGGQRRQRGLRSRRRGGGDEDDNYDRDVEGGGDGYGLCDKDYELGADPSNDDNKNFPQSKSRKHSARGVNWKPRDIVRALNQWYGFVDEHGENKKKFVREVMKAKDG